MEPDANSKCSSSDSFRMPPENPACISPATFAAPAGWSIIDCLRILRRNGATLMCTTVAGFVLAAALCILQPRYFQSTAAVEVQNINENFLNFRDIYQTVAPSADSSGNYIQTQVEILQQDALIDLVAKRLQLDRRVEFLGQHMFWERFFQNGDRNLASRGQKLVEEVREHIQVMPVRNSRIIQIVSDSQDAQLAADMANTLAEVFISARTEERRLEAQRTYDSLKLSLEGLRRQLVQSEARFGVDGPRLTIEPVQSAGALPLIGAPLKGELDATARFYQTMLQRLNDAAVASSVLQGNIRLLSRARPAESPYRPNVSLNLVAGVLCGFLVGACWVMLREQTHSVLSAAGEAGKYLTVPELGAIPRFSDGVLGVDLGQHGIPVTASAPQRQQMILSEAFRNTLTSILSSGNTSTPRTFVITSSLPSEGKTTVLSNLGIALTEIAGKVLLVDGDMRRPRLHQIFRQPNSWGLTDVLREQNAIEDLPVEALVRKTTLPGLFLLPSGPCIENIFGLLHSGRLSRLLLRFRQEFDYVLIDAPPCLEFADARVAARCADQLLLVVKANWTTKQTAQAAIRRLSMDGIPLMGIILNHCNPDQKSLYG